jgi:hypothetical protein
MNLDRDESYFWGKPMQPVISRLTYEQHKRLDDAAPNRMPGVRAAEEYLSTKIRHLRMTATIPALVLIGLALTVGAVVWGRGQ